MDPFTQRMLERAKARREKLDTQLSNAGHDVKRRRSPLRDANLILAQTPVITDAIKKSPTKMVKPSTSATESAVSPAKTIRKQSPISSPKKVEKPNKENTDDPASSVKSKLQRLGKLYSDDHTELSSPIHRTEEKFAVEEPQPSARPCARLNRLKNLASEINNWEDDLSHPTVAKPSITKAERVQAKMNSQVKSGSDSPSTSGLSRFGNKKESPAKPVKWDQKILESLGSSPQKSPQRSSPVKTSVSSALSKIDEKPSSSVASSPASTRSTDSQPHLRTPEKKGSAGSSPAVSNSRLRFGYNANSSPKTSLVQSPGSVLSKASMFESKGSATKIKDPAEMSLSERKALFERNKGEALIPKAPLTMSVPTKMLNQEKEKSTVFHGNEYNKFKNDAGRGVEAQRSLFEQGNRVQELENNILQSVQAERQRELEMLRSRFNRHREIVQSTVGANMRTSESSDAGKPNSPKNSPVCPVRPTPAPEQAAPPPPPPPMPFKNSNRQNGILFNKQSPPKRQVSASPPKQAYQMKKLDEAKRVKISSPTRTSRLYPDLTNLSSSETETETEFTIESTEAETATLDEATETGTEAEYYVKDTTDSSDDDYDDDEDDIANTSLGRSILQAVSQNTPLHKKRSIDPDPDSTTSDISVLDEMDHYLDECLANQDSGEEGPTPPKLNRSGKSPSAKSHSFKYHQGSMYRSPIKVVSPASSPSRQRYNIIVEDDCDKSPLVHSVSLYRKQQSQTPKTSARVVTRTTTDDETDSSSHESPRAKEAGLVQDKVKRLIDEVQKQQTIIGQASQALNLCNSTIEFSGSQEQVEGERLLLVATHRRQAALNEIQRLKVEGSLRPVVSGASEFQESGSLTISAITLPLKKDFYRQLEPDTCLHFVCLVRYLENVIVTPVVRAEPGDSCLRFPSTLKLQDLYSDFKVTIEVYSLKTRAEILPHDIKYHIHGGSKKSKTPKKAKHESKFAGPNMFNPAGPSAVRTPSFTMAGFMIFSLKEVHRQQFTLSKLMPETPLDGKLMMHISCELTVAVDHHGFLTMFEDISGFGAWHRRWCLLKGSTLSYWKYPDDERKKTPIGSLDLQSVTTTNVSLVSRDICARPHTFLLESSRPAQPGDVDSLVMVRNGPNTTIRHLLSADTKEDRLEWCAKLNKTLHVLHAWGGEFNS